MTVHWPLARELAAARITGRTILRARDVVSLCMLAVLVMLASACDAMVAPFDGQPVRDRTSTLQFRGYLTNPDQEVRIYAQGHAERVLLDTARSSPVRTSPVMSWSPAAPDLYEWTASAVVPLDKWQPASDGTGFSAAVFAEVGSGEAIRKLNVFRAGFEECATKRTWTEAFECALSPSATFAQVYTTDYPISADFRIVSMSLFRGRLSMLVDNAGRAGFVNNISCIRRGVAATALTSRVRHGPGARGYDMVLPGGPGAPAPVNCTVVGVNVDGSAEWNTGDNTKSATL